MKRLFFYVSIICVLYSCSDKPLFHRSEAADIYNSFSIDEARTWFEDGNGMSCDENKCDSTFMPTGDFTPCWDKAVVSENRVKASVDVPILADYCYECIISSFTEGRAIAKKVKAEQRLLVVKDIATDEINQLVLMLIPDYDYYKYHKTGTYTEFCSSSSKGKYSGIAIYIHDGKVLRVNRYYSGTKIAGIYLPSGREETMIENINKAKAVIGAIKFLRGRVSPRTKYYGGELDGAIVDDWWTPPVFPDWPDEPPIDPDPEPEIPFIDETQYPNNPQEPTESAEKIIQNKLANVLGNKIANILKRTKIEVTSILPIDKKAITYAKLFDKTDKVRVYIYYDLTAKQRQLVMAHEFMHLSLFQIAQEAGSSKELGLKNSELLVDFNLHTSDGTTDVDSAHHNYMANHVEEMETLLRNAFPGESEEFYEYGKWGGGLVNCEAFMGLSKDEQIIILEYLNKFEK